MRFLKNYLLLLLALLSVPALAEEKVVPYILSDKDKAALTRIEAYLNTIQTISAEFIQASPNGDISSGKFYLQRPGKLHMEYAPPTPVLMVASGKEIVYYDKELDQVTHIPMEETLVGFLAQDKVKFDHTVIITAMQRADKALSVSLVQAKRPADGSLTLEFSDSPVALRRMVVKDSAGQLTTVSLNNARFNFPLPPSLFIFKDPHLAGSRSIRK